MVVVKASRPYRPWLGGSAEVQVAFDAPLTLGELLARLAREWPAFSALPLDDLARLREQVLFYSGGRFLRPEDIIAPGATIELMPPTAGG